MFLKKKLYEMFLPKLLRNACPNSIPRSGENGKRVNCFSIAWDEMDNSPFLLVTGFSNGEISGLRWSGTRYDNEFSLSIEEAERSYLFKVVNFYGLTDIHFNSIYDLVLHQISKWVYLKIRIRRTLESISGYYYNKNPLVTKKRTELLKFLVDNYLDSTHGGINSFSLMTSLYSMRWVSHPEGDRTLRKIELYLNALVSEEALRRENDEYVVQGAALSFLERYEEEDQRHRDSISLSRKVLWLSVLVAITGVIATDIIKVPTLVDFSSGKEKSKD